VTGWCLLMRTIVWTENFDVAGVFHRLVVSRENSEWRVVITKGAEVDERYVLFVRFEELQRVHDSVLELMERIYPNFHFVSVWDRVLMVLSEMVLGEVS
jgi:hypothetical protein